LTHFIDDGGGIVLLLLGGEALPFVENYLLLLRRFLALFGFRNGRDEFSAPAILNDALSRLALIVQFPMTPRTLVGRVQYGPFEKGIGHGQFPLVTLCFRAELLRAIANKGDSVFRAVAFFHRL